MAETFNELAAPRDPPRPTRSLWFLIIDDHPERRGLVARTLMRKFPHSTVSECQTAEAAFNFLEKQTPSLIVAHRTIEFDALSLVRELRQRAPDAPILMSAGIDRREAALKAGADDFIMYDEWLMVGNRVLEMLARPRTEASFG